MRFPLQPADEGRFRKRLWLWGGGLGLFLLTLSIGNQLIPRDRAVTSEMLGHDFLAFYTAGHFARTGQIDKIYDLKAVKEFQTQTGREAGLELGESFGPFWNPPFYAWVFAPLSALSYGVARDIWWTIGLGCFAASVWLLCRMLPAGAGWKAWGLVPLLLIISLPFQQVVSHGQNTFVSLFILTATVTLWMKAQRGYPSSRDSALKPSPRPSPGVPGEGALVTDKVRPYTILAGLVGGLLFYKPQLGAVVAAVLVLTLGWRALVGLAITGGAMLAITVLTMPGIIEIYLARMPENLRWMQEDNQYLWERHMTIKAFWRLLIQGHDTGPTSPAVVVLWILCTLGLGSGLLSAIVRTLQRARIQSDEANRSARLRLIAATIVSMPLLMPFYFDYDLLLMAVPAVLLAADVMAREKREKRANTDRWLVRAWVVFYCWMMVSPGMTGTLHFHLAVLLLSIIATMQIARVLRRESEALSIGEPEIAPLAEAA